MCWLANNQGRESLALVAATLIHFPIQRGKHPRPAPSRPQLGMRPREVWAKIGLATQRQTGHLGNDPGGAEEATVSGPTWRQVGPQWPSSV